jgi:hypothetical protein
MGDDRCWASKRGLGWWPRTPHPPSICQIVLLKEQESESSPGRKTAGVEGPFSGPLFFTELRDVPMAAAQKMLIGRHQWRRFLGRDLLEERLVRF